MTTPTGVRSMRTSVLFTVLCGLGPALLGAQDTAIVIIPESAGVSVQPRELPRIVAEEAIRLYNAPTTTRLVGRTRLPPGNEWRGDVAVRNGSNAGGGGDAGTGVVVNGEAADESAAGSTGGAVLIGVSGCAGAAARGGCAV